LLILSSIDVAKAQEIKGRVMEKGWHVSQLLKDVVTYLDGIEVRNTESNNENSVTPSIAKSSSQ